ncbi:NAD(P)-binding protein [Neptunomonas phycophila]|uniref:NAD(P)-binding protein n=1 Tax=Neptunomonas phycophila TaxID=1572645 RepID=A0AAW7XQ76_9GAMM|nr:NAD(P)-binding protein [Neptunomonas phycophila]MDO6455167.1 NAD(P)-binding protein [Neptunomonas phycophila]
MTKQIAIVGAGLSGCILANELNKAGFQVTVYEKSRGTGGRLSSARVGEASADIGLPYFENISEPFDTWLRDLPCIVPWPTCVQSIEQNISTQNYWVASPRFSALTRTLLSNATLMTRCRISHVWPDNLGVILRDENGDCLDRFDAAVITTPAPQAVSLLESIPRFAHKAEVIQPSANWILIIGLSVHSQVTPDIVLSTGPIKRAVRNSAKPGRRSKEYKEVWVVEASDEWSRSHIDTNADSVSEHLLQAFEHVLDQKLTVAYTRSHRWLYAKHHTLQTSNPTETQQVSYLWSEHDKIAVCGDWILAGEANLPPAEAAWQSATQLARLLIEELKGS